MDVRPLHERDRDACMAIAQALPEWFDAGGKRMIGSSLAGEAGFVAEEGPRVLGFVTWVPGSGGEAVLTWMAVDRERRGQGVGTALCEALFEDLRARDYESVVVSTLAETVSYAPYEATRAFYERRGFVRVRVDPAFWAPDLDRLLLRRDLRRLAT